jgi:vacuolar-type H+-ATPase subunit H
MKRGNNMKKKLVIFALMIIGLLISFMSVQKGNGVYAETEDKLVTTITPTKAKKAYDDSSAIKVLIENQFGSYSDTSGVYIYLGNKTENMAFKFEVDISADSNIYVNHKLTPNKLYTLDDMNLGKCNAIIGETEYNYKSASIMLISDENGYISYSAMVELENNDLYNLVEADPVSGEWTIEEYDEHITSNNQGQFSLTDTETKSKFVIVINDYDSSKKSYDLSEIYYDSCKIGARSWDCKTLTFTRNVDDDGLVHVVVAVVTEHGDTLSLVYNQPDPDLIAAQAVIEKIDALPELSEITIDDKNSVETTRTAYDALTEKQKSNISADTLKVLTDAEAKIAALEKDAADTKAANAVIEKINALPEVSEITLDDKNAVETARTSYNTLTADQKAKVSQEILKKLTDAEAKITSLEKDAADTKAANAVIERINALPEVSKITLDDKNDVATARAAYNALTVDQKAKVSSDTVNKLSNAEAKLAELQSSTPVKQGLSAGAIVGIVIGSILVVTIVGCLVLFILNKKGIINIPFLNKKEQKVDDSDTNKDK